MAATGFLVDANELPFSDLGPTLPEARKLYVIRALSEVGTVRHALEDPNNPRFLGSAIHTLPNLWDAEREYCQTVNEVILGQNSDGGTDPLDLIKQEDRARLVEYQRCAEETQIHLKISRIRKVARGVRIPTMSDLLPKHLMRRDLALRTHHVLKDERDALEAALLI